MSSNRLLLNPSITSGWAHASNSLSWTSLLWLSVSSYSLLTYCSRPGTHTSGVYPPLSDGSNFSPPRIREIASAKGAKLRLPKARSPLRLGSLRERRKLPQVGLGRSPRNRRDFEHFMPNGVHFGLLLISYLKKNQIEKIEPKPRTMNKFDRIIYIADYCMRGN